MGAHSLRSCIGSCGMWPRQPSSISTRTMAEMQAIQYQKAGPAQSQKIFTVPRPVPGDNEALIRVCAFGLNFADIVARQGEYQDAPPFPMVPGYEVSGYVEEFGSDDAAEKCSAKVGDRVLAFTMFGGYAEYAVARIGKRGICLTSPEEGIVPLPSDWTFEMGASVPVQFATAYHCLFETGDLRPASRVLIHAAAGGVGQAAIQLCKHVGCEVIIGTCGSDKKVELIKELGCTHGFNYRTKTDYADAVKQWFPDGIDVTLNSLGGDTVKKDLSLLRPGGRVVGFGGAGFQGIPWYSKIAVCGVNMKRLGDARPDLLQSDLENVMALFQKGVLTTHVSETHDWSQVAEAHARMEGRKTTGKVVLTIAEASDAAQTSLAPNDDEGDEDGASPAGEEDEGPAGEDEEPPAAAAAVAEEHQ